MSSEEVPGRWLLLVHQLPAQPAYARVKLHRRLQAIGAVAVKKTVHALPVSDETLEDLLWTAKEVEAAGGEAMVCNASFVAGVNDAHLRQVFDAARDADYRALAAEVRKAPRESGAKSALPRFRKRLADIAALDFFGADGRDAAEAALLELENLMQNRQRAPQPIAKTRSLAELRGRTWVTRKNVHVDRIACAWFIRKFIDPKARFRFVDPTAHSPRRNELRFDMADAEFTHRADLCSFEVLLAESKLREPALRAIAEIVHDLDLKDGKFGRAETEGVRQLLAGITLANDDDDARLERGAMLFDDLYRSLQRKPRGTVRR